MNTQAKKTALQMIPHGVFVLTIKNGNDENASTISWLTQASFEPPLIVVAIKNKTATCSMVEESGYFGINFLSKDQTEMAGAFLTKAEARDGKLNGYTYVSAQAKGSPIFTQAAAWIECQVTDQVKRGDHTIFVAEVIDAGVQSPDVTSLQLADTPWQYGG